jgi:predicted helicase
MTVADYVANLNERYKTGISREHSYRGDLQTLLESMLDNVLVTNEPARIECGAPDYILTNKGIPVGYMEAKDIGEPLKGKKHKEQFDRYRESLPNLIITDYLDFHLYREGEFVTSISIAERDNGTIESKPEKFDQFKDLINDFATHTAQTITSSSKLSKMMAGKARLLSTIIENALNSDADDDRVSEAANNTLREQLEAFQNVLIHDIDAKEFADIYAQTIAYGMFAARLHDPTLDSFSRQEAAQLIPKTNPFLRKLFQYIAGYDLDERIDWVVDALADIFRATDVGALLKDFGKATQQNDPIIHFYETFLAEFDPDLRKSRGVWYTPEPVVNFIVRAVDDILKDEFDLSDGLADTSKTTVKVNTDVKDNRSSTGYRQEEKEVHKVQILDPAAGTGTFLAEVINQIYKKFEGQKGIWPSYVENHLIPRLNGFELLMASYAMAHLKLDMLLRETGYSREANQRFRVYLTNSLEEHHPDTGTLFANWLSEEANQANHVKRDTPVMVVMGNPPYSGISSNMGDWITNLIEDYKYVDGDHFGEKKHWLHDDYVKFIRYGQHFVEKNGEGVLTYINNHGFLDNPTFRGMRWNLLKTFDKIYVLDLHGNTMKNETPPNGKKDENVFDIQQGVSINIFIKDSISKSDTLADVYHCDLWGKRSHKYTKLWESDIADLEFQHIEPVDPFYFFVPLDYSIAASYNEGFSLENLFNENVTGIVTARDSLVIDSRREKLLERMDKFSNLDISDSEIRDIFFKSRKGRKYPPGDSRGWKLPKARQSIYQNDHDKHLKKIHYRPFDLRYIYYTPDMVDWGRENLMPEVFHDNNPGIVFPRQAVTDNWSHIQVTNSLIDNRLHYSNKGIPLFAPLYIHSDSNGQQTLDGQPQRKPNLDAEIVQDITNGLGLTFVPEPESNNGSHSERSGAESKNLQDKGNANDKEIPRQARDGSKRTAFAPIDLLDYIYAVLHSPTYREKYKEFLKIDFPRVPYPTDAETFWQLVELGGELRQIHLLEHPIVNDFITTYPVKGSNEITKRLTKTKPGFILYEEDGDQPTTTDGVHLEGGPHLGKRYPGERLGKIQINNEQYFGIVPEKAWNFYIGGYQPAEKWLKDRRDRELSFEEIQHYQKIIVALMETDRIMGKIDEIEIA